MRGLLGLVVMVGLGVGVARADSGDCDNRPVTGHGFQQQAGDVVQGKHLEAMRAFAGSGKLMVSICNADVRVLSRPEATQLELTVNLEGSRGVAEYVQAFEVRGDGGTVQLKFPKGSKAQVTLGLPMRKNLDFEFNLGKGNLDFMAAGSAGSRQINVGMGSMKLVVGEKTYANMELNIGLGTLHDHRAGEKDGHFVVSREYTGGGDGSVEVNVGMGSLDIRKG